MANQVMISEPSLRSKMVKKKDWRGRRFFEIAMSDGWMDGWLLSDCCLNLDGSSSASEARMALEQAGWRPEYGRQRLHGYEGVLAVDDVHAMPAWSEVV